MRMARLSDVVDFYSGGTPSKSSPELWDGSVPWFSAKDIKKPLLSDSADHVSDDVFTKTSLRRLPAGTLVMVVRGMILAHTVPISVLEVEATINQDLKALIPREEVDPTFLAAMLQAQHSSILAQVSTAAHGTTKLETRVLENVQVPLPPIGEQRRIAAILDHADALRAKRRQVHDHLDDLTQSIFDDMFAKSSDSPVPLSDLAAVTSGLTKGRKTTEPTRPLPYLAVSNVQAGSLKLDVVKNIEATDREVERYALMDGDLVLTEGGDPDKLGRGTVWRSELPLCLHQNHVFRVRPRPSVLADYLAFYLGSPAARAYFRRSAKQTTGIASINMTQLKAAPVAVPTMEQQQEFVARLRAVRESQGLVRRLRRRDDELVASLQSRAFRGEL